MFGSIAAILNSQSEIHSWPEIWFDAWMLFPQSITIFPFIFLCFLSIVLFCFRTWVSSGTDPHCSMVDNKHCIFIAWQKYQLKKIYQSRYWFFSGTLSCMQQVMYSDNFRAYVSVANILNLMIFFPGKPEHTVPIKRLRKNGKKIIFCIVGS